MRDDLDMYLELAEYASKDATIIPNHIEHNVPERLQKFLDDCWEILSWVKNDDDKEYIQRLQKEICQIELALSVYTSETSNEK